MKLIKSISKSKPLRIIFGIFKTLLTIVLIAMLLVIIVQRVSNNNLSIGGYRIFAVASQSMMPEYKVGDVLVAKEVKPSEVKVGDDLVYLGLKDDFANKIVTHRVMHVSEENGVYSFDTKGIANEIMDPTVNQEQIYGIVSYKTVFLSLIGELMTKASGYFTLCTIVAVMVSFQIVKAFFYNKNGENEEQDDKIISKEVTTKEIDKEDNFINSSNEGDELNETKVDDSMEEL